MMSAANLVLAALFGGVIALSAIATMQTTQMRLETAKMAASCEFTRVLINTPSGQKD